MRALLHRMDVNGQWCLSRRGGKGVRVPWLGTYLYWTVSFAVLPLILFSIMNRWNREVTAKAATFPTCLLCIKFDHFIKRTFPGIAPELTLFFFLKQHLERCFLKSWMALNLRLSSLSYRIDSLYLEWLKKLQNPQLQRLRRMWWVHLFLCKAKWNSIHRITTAWSIHARKRKVLANILSLL